MVKQFMKKKSKRLSCRKRYKIERKVREHDRKARKAASKKTRRKGPAVKPAVIVPGKCPFKEELLVEAQRRKEVAEELKTKRKEARQKLVDKKRSVEKEKKKPGDLSDLASEAALRSTAFESDQLERAKNDSASKSDELKGLKTKVYFSEVRKVLDAADVILEVLDARDPLGSRCAQLEKRVLADPRKRLVLLLNKIDLVPKTNLLAWIKYLREELPTIAFKASTQTQRTHLGQQANASSTSTATSRCIGADLLMKLLANYSRLQSTEPGGGVRTCIRVGVVGFPNVGKSSVINSLRRAKSCLVGATPGLTKCVQEVELDKHIRLLDSPGVVLAAAGSTPADMALRNAVKVESIEDPIAAVETILRRCAKDKLMLQYAIGDFDSTNEFLALLARKLGRLRKGGVPDAIAAARRLLHDWNDGKIRFYTTPPVSSASTSARATTTLLATMSSEFCLDEIDSEQDRMIDEESTAIVLSASSEVPMMEMEDEEMQAVGSDELPLEIDLALVAAAEKRKAAGVASEPVERKMTRERKLAKKANRKKMRRREKVANSLSDKLDSAMAIDEEDEDAYDFGAMAE